MIYPFYHQKKRSSYQLTVLKKKLALFLIILKFRLFHSVATMNKTKMTKNLFVTLNEITKISRFKTKFLERLATSNDIVKRKSGTLVGLK